MHGPLNVKYILSLFSHLLPGLQSGLFSLESLVFDRPNYVLWQSHYVNTYIKSSKLCNVSNTLAGQKSMPHSLMK